MANLNELLPAFDFCNNKNMPEEAKKIRELVNVYIDFSIIEHKKAIETLTKPVTNDEEKTKEE